MLNSRRTLRLAMIVVACAMALPAADAPSVRKDVMEAGVFMGASFAPGANGATFDGFRAMGGGNVTYSVWKYVLPYVEYGYFPGVEGVYTVASDHHIDYTMKVHDFHGGVHVRTEAIPGTHLVPYGVLGLGGIRSNFTGTDYHGTRTQALTETATLPCLNYGGGLRYYFNENFGVRVEMKGYKPFRGNAELTRSFGKVEFGIFWQKKLGR